MAAGPSIDVSGWLEEQLAQASPDLLRAMVTMFAEALMGAEADAVCGAGYGERSDERRNTRNGYRRREWDTRAGSISLAIPKLRQGSYFPDWLLERRARGEKTGAGVVGGVCPGQSHLREVVASLLPVRPRAWPRALRPVRLPSSRATPTTSSTACLSRSPSPT
jgi:hypothetical protein